MCIRDSLGSESCQALLVNVYAQWLVAGYADVKAQIKLVSVDQQRVSDILRNDACLVDVDVVDVIYKVDAAALAGVCRFDDPNVFLAFVLLQLLVVVIKVSELVGENVCVWHEVECTFAVALLHAHDVEAKAVFASDFVRLREMIDFLVLI